jgi:hypothetical protein
MRKKILFTTFALIGLAFAATGSPAQTPAPTPSDERVTVGGYNATSSIEIGARGLMFDGSDEKYRSDLNYRPGFRLWNSSLRLEGKDGKGKYFDSLSVSASGWGADPTGFVRVGMDKTGAYRFDANVRKMNLINRVNNLTLGYHPSDTTRNLGDFDVTLFPERDTLRVRLGVSFNKAGGERGSSTRTRDVFPMMEYIDSQAMDYRLGVDTKLAGFKMTLTGGLRNFRDRGEFRINTRQAGFAGTCFFGICIAPDVNFINRLSRKNPTSGDTGYGIFTIQRTWAQRLDMTGRFIHSRSESKFSIFEDMNYDGQIRLPTGVTSPNLFVDADIYDINGRSKRPQSRGDVGLTLAATNNIRLSNTFTYDQFTSFGNSDVYQRTTARLQSNGLPYTGGQPQPPNFLDTRSVFWRQHDYKRFTNTVESDFQVHKRFSFSIGYRYTHRKVGVGVRNQIIKDLLNRPLAAPTFSEDEHENTAHILLFGTKIKPRSNWTIYAKGERGSADNAFVRLANHDFTNFSVKSNVNVNKFTFNVSGIIRNNENPSRTADYRNAAGTIILPAFDIIANVRTRVFSTYVDYVPAARWTLSTGYTYNYLSSQTDTVVPLALNAAQPPNPVGNAGFLRGFSEFYIKENYFFVDLSAQPMDRVSLYAGYRYNNDIGQGNRAATQMERFLSSYPFRSHNPELRMAIKLTRNLDWNLGYQYNRYDEKLQFGYFPYNNLVNTNIIPANATYPTNQNYRAHMPYTSLRIYFGGGR